MHDFCLKIGQNFMGTELFLTFVGINLDRVVEIIWGGAIFVTTLSLFHSNRNSQHPIK